MAGKYLNKAAFTARAERSKLTRKSIRDAPRRKETRDGRDFVVIMLPPADARLRRLAEAEDEADVG